MGLYVILNSIRLFGYAYLILSAWQSDWFTAFWLLFFLEVLTIRVTLRR